MNFKEKIVFKLPEWQGELTFSREYLVFVGWILFLFVGILLCFFGYKYFRVIGMLAMLAVAFAAGFFLAERITESRVWQVYISVLLAVLIAGVCYMAVMAMDWLLAQMKVKYILEKNLYLLSAGAGAVIIALILFFFVIRSLLLVVIIGAALFIPGALYQHRMKKQQIRYKTYDDLKKMC